MKREGDDVQLLYDLVLSGDEPDVARAIYFTLIWRVTEPYEIPDEVDVDNLGEFSDAACGAVNDAYDAGSYEDYRNSEFHLNFCDWLLLHGESVRSLMVDGDCIWGIVCVVLAAACAYAFGADAGH
jgi:hypothetical protein